MIDVVMNEQIETRTRVETVETLSVTPGQRQCVTSPKIELTGQAALEVGLSYGIFEGTGTLSGTAKVTAARQKCFTPIVTKYKKVRITEQRKLVVMGQGFWGLSDAVIDEWEADVHTAWEETGRHEFEEEETEESNVTTQWVDPPGLGSPNTMLRVSSGALLPDFSWVDGSQVPVEVGSTRSSVEIRLHEVLIDGSPVDESVSLHVRGSSPLSVGSHVLTLLAHTDFGTFTFDLPVEIEPVLSIRLADSVRPFLYDELRDVTVEITNNEATGRNVAIYVVTSPGWEASLPPRIWIPAASRTTVQVKVHAAPRDERSAIGRLEVSAVTQDGGPATVAVDVLAQFPVQTLRVYERAMVQAGLARQTNVALAPAPAAPFGAVTTSSKSTDCGPTNVEAKERGDWRGTRKEARESARDAARAASSDSCRGDCASPTRCNYLEKSISLTGPEERPDPQNPNSIQYRYECTSKGECQCE